MVERVVQAHLSISWVMADCAYGSNARLQASGYCLVLAVRCTEPIEIQTPIGRVRMTVAEDRAHLASGLAVPLDGRRKQGASLVRLGVFADLAPLRRRWVPLPARPAHGDGAEQKAFYARLWANWDYVSRHGSGNAQGAGQSKRMRETGKDSVMDQYARSTLDRMVSFDHAGDAGPSGSGRHLCGRADCSGRSAEPPHAGTTTASIDPTGNSPSPDSVDLASPVQ